jgi:carbon-monoxide dehydrogenase small subunit
MSTWQLLSKNTDPDDRAIRKALAGNTCRCTGYQNIFKAVRAGAKAARSGAQP